MSKSKNIKILIIYFIISLLIITLLFFINNYKIENFENKIPANLFMTWENKIDMPDAMRENINKIINNNSDLNVQIFDKNDRRDFIEKYFDPDVLNAYDRLIPGAFKADLWRYCVLYIHGGIYMDIKFELANGFNMNELLKKEHFVKHRPDRQVFNGFMVCLAGNEKLYKIIHQIVINVRTKFYGDTCLDPTGPLLVAKYFTDEEFENVDMEYHSKAFEPEIERDFITWNGDGTQRIIIYKNNTVHSEQSSHSSIQHYSVLWNSRAIYKE